MEGDATGATMVNGLGPRRTELQGPRTRGVTGGNSQVPVPQTATCARCKRHRAPTDHTRAPLHRYRPQPRFRGADQSLFSSWTACDEASQPDLTATRAGRITGLG